jgi:hypothetical protein
MKPGPRRSADISAVMSRAKQVELDESELWVIKAQKKVVGKRKIGRPRKPSHPIEEAAETATMNAPRLWEPDQSMRGLSAAEVEAANAILMFSFHTAFLAEIVHQLQRIL